MGGKRMLYYFSRRGGTLSFMSGTESKKRREGESANLPVLKKGVNQKHDLDEDRSRGGKEKGRRKAVLFLGTLSRRLEGGRGGEKKSSAIERLHCLRAAGKKKGGREAFSPFRSKVKKNLSFFCERGEEGSEVRILLLTDRRREKHLAPDEGQKERGGG